MKTIGLALALLLAPTPRDTDRALIHPTRAAVTQLGYETYTWYYEDHKPIAVSKALPMLPAGSTYRVLPLRGDEILERPRCTRILVTSGSYAGKRFYVIAEHLGPSRK